jgi:transcriptional regulator with XRE-family HTH domain
VADNLWALREQKKLSVAALANRAGLPISVIVEYESGRKGVDPRHLNRLARALYVEEFEIRLQSDPRPETGPREAPAETPRAESAEPAHSVRPKATAFRARSMSRPAPPAKPTQLTHIIDLLEKLGRVQADAETQLGKPLAQLDRLAASEFIRSLQSEITKANLPNRHRGYLPEAVDEFENRYLTEVRDQGAVLHITLFNGTQVDGALLGFGPYSFTLRCADQSETTVNKLAIVSYTKERLA